MAVPSASDRDRPPVVHRRTPFRHDVVAGIAAGAALVGLGAAAERRYRRILAVEADHPGALSGLGRLLARQRRFAEAAVVWERAAAARPTADFPAYQLARALYRSGRYEAAAAAYLRLL